MNKVNVSIVLAVKNEEIYIKDAILSILSQKEIATELIIVDDNSTDKTYDILNEIQNNFKSIKLYHNSSKGKTSAFNYGVSKSTGDYICLFAGDDIMPEGSLYARWKNSVQYSQGEAIVQLCKLRTLSVDKKLDNILIPRKSGKGAVSGACFMINRKCADIIFPIPECLPNEDTWMELAVTHLDRLNIYHTDTVGCNWRIHENNSINLLVCFEDFNKKITPRMEALRLFYNQYENVLTEKNKESLIEKIKCEDYRRKGDFIAIILSKDHIIGKLRSISIANSFFYNIRKRFYSLFSGW